MDRDFRRILGLQLTNTFAETFAWGFIYLHAAEAGHSEAGIATFFAVMFGYAALAVPLISRRVHTGRSMTWGLVLRMIGFLVVVNVAWYQTLMFAAVLWGAFVMLFWVPYNVVFLRMTSDTDRAGRSTTLFALFAVASAVFPLVGGVVIDRQGFWLVAIIAVAALGVGAVVAGRTHWGGPMEFDLARAFRDCRRLVPLVGTEGFWQGVVWIAVPIGTLRMVDQSTQYGAFLAFLGIMSGVASVAAGRWSDRSRDRLLPLTISSVGVVVLSLVVPFTEGDLVRWSLAVGGTFFFSIMMMAFTFTLVAELGTSVDDSMGLREVMFSLGRAGGGGLFVVTLVLEIDMIWPVAFASVALLLMLIGYTRMLRPVRG
jgi:MFS family permease